MAWTFAVVDVNCQHVSAHSLKATGLSWSARYGLTWPDRAILGRHQSHTNETVAIYSRDLSVGPVSRFAEMVRAISLGAFCPDAERSQYFPFPPAPPMEESAKGSFEKQVDELGVEAADSDFCKVEWQRFRVSSLTLWISSQRVTRQIARVGTPALPRKTALYSSLQQSVQKFCQGRNLAHPLSGLLTANQGCFTCVGASHQVVMTTGKCQLAAGQSQTTMWQWIGPQTETRSV